MNATILYADLSRRLLELKENPTQESFDRFLNPETGVFKLRTLLLCRFCRSLCTEPYSSELCSHLLCKLCYNEKRLNNGCKWCKIFENLMLDNQSKLLVGLYKNLCAILKSYATESADCTKNVKERLIHLLKEENLSNAKTSDFLNPPQRSLPSNSEKLKPVKKQNAGTQSDLTPCDCKIKTELIVTSKSICTQTDFAPEKVVVTSTSNENDDLSKIMPSKALENNETYSEVDNLTMKKVYKTISSTVLKKRKRMSIFEKFGLALTPPSQTESIKNSPNELNSSKLNKSKLLNGNSEPKMEPLKLKMKRVPSDDSNDSQYSVHYNITNQKYDNHLTDDESPIDTKNAETRKNKRRASTFITNYAIFSDDSSDFEAAKSFQKQRKPHLPKESREGCGCGAGSNLKFYTDICKRSRCPCFSQEKGCYNCKCRFCSNPYAAQKSTTDSESFSEESGIQDEVASQTEMCWSTKDESDIVDIEAM